MSHPSPTFALPRSAPPARVVPRFDPVRTGRTGRTGGFGLRRTVRRRRRAMAAGLALTAAALAAAAPSGRGHTDAVTSRAPAPAGEERRGGPRPAMVSAPVRIADAAAVRLLHPGDRVDVLATPLPDAVRARSSGATARVVARGVRVADVPGARSARATDGRADGGAPEADADADASRDEAPDGGGALDGPAGGGGALVVLTVPRADATALAGASAGSRLAVTLCRC
ncbi:RcpC/CpaB family pilus assembly protein [Streptomyces rugosispiralis]|uniref:RcpC/CpaB family pilus assembly protein n=1 Tax=Streptomyces rugosispiralis TaxID=2967341 RepID=A0ABT1V752_9ACTN|nr:RcpC/CpaB family pilus assembly protein [Streptomyces rugosispiralis]MCQ8193117.1 RcpC/CpaB family pilus assembly protein [Streptomyces rugosispiralis]